MDSEDLISQAMSELARRRWNKTSPAERTEYAHKMNEGRWKGKSKKQRKATAKKAAEARWAKARKGKAGRAKAED